MAITNSAARNAAANQPSVELDEVILTWFAWAFLTIVLFITYARIPPTKLYNVSRAGLAGGSSRVLVQLNFPAALVAIAIAGVLAARARQVMTAPTRRPTITAIAFGAALCAIVAVPGVVRQNDLDARWINVPAALGVLILAGLTVKLAHGHRRVRIAPRQPGDSVRVAAAIPLALIALPWLFAEAGFYIGRMAVIGGIFLSVRVPPGQTEAAVHLGHHHGADGFYLAMTALFLSRALPRIGAGKLKTALGLYLALMLAYGIGNLANDAWTEQVWKRGWSARSAPSVLVPALTPAWSIVVLGALAIYLFGFHRLPEPDGNRQAFRAAAS